MLGNNVIAIDGTAGAGKGTLARGLAEAFNLPYLDTGKLYRAVAAKRLEGHGDGLAIARDLTLQDLKRSDLRTPPVTQEASNVAKDPKIREALVGVQRNFAAQHGAVLDGRDIGTVIFPSAAVKFFLTASPRVRAQRRFLQEGGTFEDPQAAQQIKEIEEAICRRDAQDEARQHAPLRVADDAHVIDTDGLGIDEIRQQAIHVARQRFMHLKEAENTLS